MTQLDFNALLREAKTAGQALPDGDYNFEITEAQDVIASTGSPMIKVKLRVLDGAHAGKTVLNNFVLSVDNPSALAMFFRNMTALGCDDSFFTQIGQGTLAPVAAAIRGRRGIVTLGQREWPAGSGNMRNEVKNVKAGTQAGVPGATVGVGVPTPGMPGIPGFPGGNLPNGFPTPAVSAPVPMPAAPPVPAPVAAPPVPPAPAPVPQSAQIAQALVPPPAPAAVAPPAPAAVAPPAPAAVAPPVPAPVPAPASEVEFIPPGYEAMWGILTSEQKQMVLMSTGAPATVPAPAQATAAPAAPPPSPF